MTSVILFLLFLIAYAPHIYTFLFAFVSTFLRPDKILLCLRLSFSTLNKSSSDYPSISICIPVLNGEKLIAEKLKNTIECASSLDCEIIIYNDGSTDQTLDIVRNYLNNNSSCVSVRLYNSNEPQGRAFASNLFAKVAIHDIIVSTDVDTLLLSSDSLLSLIYPFCISSTVNCVVGRIISSSRGATSFIYSLYLFFYEEPLRILSSSSGLLSNASGPLTAYKKSIWCDIPTFTDYDNTVGFYSYFSDGLMIYRHSASAFDSVPESPKQELAARKRTISKSLASFRWIMSEYPDKIYNSLPRFFSYFFHRAFRPLSMFSLFCFFMIIILMQFSANPLIATCLFVLALAFPLSRSFLLSLFSSVLGYAIGVWLAISGRPVSGSYTPTRNI